MLGLLCRWVFMVGFLMSMVGVAFSHSKKLGQVTVIVSDRSRPAFQYAIGEGFAEVLVRLSGNPAIMTIPAIQDSFSKAGSYVSSYSYQEAIDENSKQQLSLKMIFNERALSRLLQKVGQPVWSHQRPQTLVVLAAPQNGAVIIVSNDAEGEWVDSIRSAAAKHGLPILLPLSDLEDQAILADDFSQGLSVSARSAFTTRYHVQNILFGALNDTVPEANIHWQLWMGDSSSQWITTGKTLQEMTVAGFDHLFRLFASRYAVVKTPSLQTALLLKIIGINGLDDYLKVLQTLKHLAPVNKVSVQNMSADSLVLQINVTGGQEALRQVLQTNHQLTPDFASTANNSATTLQYQWGQPDL